MGAIPHENGVAFRVWAPHATSVSVIGSFNDWSPTAHPLVHEGDGYWAVGVADARVGDAYKYHIVTDEGVFDRIDPYAREVTNSVGNGVVYDPSAFDWGDDDGFSMAPWNELVLYEMHVGTFNDEPGGEPGDFESAVAGLDHLADLGINGVELLPTIEFPGDHSWGYNPAHIFAVESAYGGPDGLKAFVKAAHERGIAVIMDVVYNHSGPGDAVLWQFDGWSENDLGGIYFYNDWRAKTPWGESRPDYGREEVRRHIRDNALMWLEEYHVDGLRWDGTAFIRNVEGMGLPRDKDIPEGWSLMQWINDEIDEKYPHVISIAEDLQNDDAMTRPTSEGGAGFDAEWDPEFSYPIRETFIANDDEGRDMERVRRAIEHDINGDAFRRIIYTESHDQVANGSARLPHEISPEDPASWYARKRSTAGAALLLTTPGIPMLFQGQEILEDEWFRTDDPVDWTRKETYRGVYQLYQDLIRLRRNGEGNTRGLSGQHVEVHHVNDEQKLVGYHRWAEGGPGDSVVVLANLSAQEQKGYCLGFPQEGMWKVRLNSDWEGYGGDFANSGVPEVEARPDDKDGMSASGLLDIGPYSVVILSQDG